MTFIVYILYSTILDRYYVGFTGDNLNERIRRHISYSKGYTGKVNDWKLVYSENHQTKQLAMTREKEIKSWKNRTKIEALFKRE